MENIIVYVLGAIVVIAGIYVFYVENFHDDENK